MLENQLITDDEFFHWLSPVFCLIVVLMFSRICLLIRPISLFAGLMSLHVGLFWKLSLWSLSVMNACRFAIHSVRSSMLRLAAMQYIAAIYINLLKTFRYKQYFE